MFYTDHFYIHIVSKAQDSDSVNFPTCTLSVFIHLGNERGILAAAVVCRKM